MPAPRARIHDLSTTKELESGVYPKAPRSDAPDLQRLYDDLCRRFHASDDDELLAELVADLAPNHLTRLGCLRRDHRSLLRSFERLLRSQDLGFWELNVELQTLLDAIVETDRAEADLLQDAWLTDLGVGD